MTPPCRGGERGSTPRGGANSVKEADQRIATPLSWGQYPAPSPSRASQSVTTPGSQPGGRGSTPRRDTKEGTGEWSPTGVEYRGAFCVGVRFLCPPPCGASQTARCDFAKVKDRVRFPGATPCSASQSVRHLASTQGCRVRFPGAAPSTGGQGLRHVHTVPLRVRFLAGVPRRVLSWRESRVASAWCHWPRGFDSLTLLHRVQWKSEPATPSKRRMGGPPPGRPEASAVERVTRASDRGRQ